MIGGADVKFDVNGPSDVILDVCTKAILTHWPAAVLQHAETAERFSSYNAVAFSRLKELFVYRDDAAFDAWVRHGADSSNANTLVHLVYDPGRLTVVVDDPKDDATARLLDSLRRAIRDVCFGLSNFGKAA